MDIRASKPHETLERVGLLRSLDAKDRVGFERRCQWRHARGKEWLLEQNDVGTDIFFLTSGVVRVLITPSPDREIILGDIEAGGYFGEMAAIDGQPRSAGILAITAEYFDTSVDELRGPGKTRARRRSRASSSCRMSVSVRSSALPCTMIDVDGAKVILPPILWFGIT